MSKTPSVKTEVLLRGLRITPSYQRKSIYEFLSESASPLTVNEIYDSLINDIPTLSKATIYNTMNVLQEVGLVDAIPIEGNEFRFELHQDEPHGHFKCQECGAVIKLRVFGIDLERTEHQIKKQKFFFVGVCASCLEKQKQKEKNEDHYRA